MIDFFKELNAAVTICDENCIITYMNDKSAKINEKDGGYDLIGKNLYDCHPEPSKSHLKRLMKEKRDNCYTIEKNGIKKMIYQAPWYEEKKFKGLVEISFEIPFEMPHFIRDSNVLIRFISKEDKGKILSILNEYWASPYIVTHGVKHDASSLPGFAAEENGEIVGIITFNVDNKQLEIISLNSLKEKRGTGTKLMNAVESFAFENNIRRIHMITTNDNNHAIYFYRKRGYNIIAIHENAIDFARKLKPEIPEIGIDNIPIKDEIELEKIIKY
jgi:N-acetylglutamate synthase-like GNAT family acetyltransferase